VGTIGAASRRRVRGSNSGAEAEGVPPSRAASSTPSLVAAMLTACSCFAPFCRCRVCAAPAPDAALSALPPAGPPRSVGACARPMRAVAAPLQEARLDQSAESPRQHIGRDAEALLELVEAREAVQGVAQDQHAPPLADPFQAAGDRTRHAAEALALH